MTCIVGIENKGEVWLGADSQVGNNACYTKAGDDGKLFRLNRCMLIGVCGSSRVSQVLRFSLTLPKHPEREDTLRYMVNRFVPKLRECLKSAGTAHQKEETESIPDRVSFLVGYMGQLYAVWSNFQVDHYAHGYAAVGSGDQLAMGAFHAMHGLPWSPIAKVKRALRAAEEHNIGVRRPFRVRRQPYARRR